MRVDNIIKPNNQQTGCLVLAPTTISTAIPNLALILKILRQIKCIGPALADVPEQHTFLVGDDFLQLITFMGCSPWLALAPPTDGGAFCHIAIDGPWVKPKFYYGSNTKGPACCQCRRRLSTWRNLLPNWLTHMQESVVLCPHCDHQQRPLELNWRREAGFGQIFIRIENIFPGEAVPVHNFLHILKDTTRNSWEYFYICDGAMLSS